MTSEKVERFRAADAAFNRADILSVQTVDLVWITPAGTIGVLTPEAHASWLAMHADRFDEYDKLLGEYLAARADLLATAGRGEAVAS